MLSLVILTAFLSTSFISLFFGLITHADSKDDMDDYLTLYYSFDDPKSLLKDFSGSVKGTVHGKVKSVDTPHGKGVHFDSSNHENNEAYIEMPVSAFGNNEMTVMMWVKSDPSTVGLYSRVFAVETASSQKSFHLMSNVGNDYSGYKAELFGGSYSKAAIRSEGLVPYAVYQDWHHVAVTYDGKTVKLFVNGSFVNDVDTVTDLSSWKLAHAFLGKTAIWKDCSFNGYMDEVRVYSKALTESQICSSANINLSDVKNCPKLLSSLSIDGEKISEFSGFYDEYYRIYDSEVKTVPKITAEPPYEGVKVSVTQADGIPGVARVDIKYPEGVEKTVTVSFLKRNSNTLIHPSLEDVTIDDPFWNPKLEMYSTTTAEYVLNTWIKQTHSNLSNFDKVAKGDRNTGNYVGSMTWGECDFYAACAGACRLLTKYPNEKLETILSNAIDHIFAASESVENGYFSIYNLLMTDGKVFSEAPIPSKAMDLFNLGYLIEFGIARYQQCGDARILRVALRFLNFTVKYSNHGEKNIVSYHMGIEYNIAELCEFLNNDPDVIKNDLLKDLDVNVDDYLELDKNLVKDRGVTWDRVGQVSYGAYSNDHVTFDRLTTATGHSVEALLYYFGMSEIGRVGDDLLFTNAAYRLWKNVTERQMYVTGGVGSIYSNEGFGGDYYLPNASYCESCTSGALAELSDSLSLMLPFSQFHDNFELELYNNLLGSIGENGKTFSYQNPLVSGSFSRWTWHGVPCCTKYGLLIYGNLPRYVYSYNDSDVYVNQYIGSTAELSLSKGKTVIVQNSDWVWNGKTSLKVISGASNVGSIFLRIPEWSTDTGITVNGKTVSFETENGYIRLKNIKDNDEIVLTCNLSVRRIHADERVSEDNGFTALKRGVFLYCLEDIDNKHEVNKTASKTSVLLKNASVEVQTNDKLFGGVKTLVADAVLYLNKTESVDYKLTFIPFFARANRKTSGYTVWVAEDYGALGELQVAISPTALELKKLGAKYTGITNCNNPQGGGSKNISVIVDGKCNYSSDSQQYDAFKASLSDSLGRNKLQWFGVEFNEPYDVKYVVFWEGGHWNDGGWFGDTPYVQVLVDGKWKDAESVVSPSYPGDSLQAQLPANESYIFVLKDVVTCSAVRIVGPLNSLAGHASCAEIEVYGDYEGCYVDPEPIVTDAPPVTDTPAVTDGQAVITGTEDNTKTDSKTNYKNVALISALSVIVVAGITAAVIIIMRKRK